MDSWRELNIKQGNLLQLKRQLEQLYPSLKKETVEDLQCAINIELRVLEFKIKYYPK